MRASGLYKCNKMINFVLIFALVLGMLSVSTGVVNADFRAASKGVFNPTVIVRVSENEILTYFWRAGTSVTLTIDDPVSGVGVDYTNTLPVKGGSNLTEELLFKIKNIKLAPGQLITLTDGISTETVQLSPVYITGVGINIDGIAQPGTMIYVNMEAPKIAHSFWAKSQSDGTWSVDIVSYYDISKIAKYSLSIWDADKDVVEYTQPYKRPYIEANLNANTIDGWDWVAGRTVTLVIDDPATETDTDFTGTMKMTGTYFYPHFVFDLGSFKLEPGQVITMTDGTITKTHVVRNLAITNVNLNWDRFSGSSNTPGDVHSWIVGDNGRVFQRMSAVANGLWTSNFSSPGYQTWDLELFNITETTQLFSKQVDEDGDATLVSRTSSTNMPPVADAGIDITAEPGSMVTLYGSKSSDPEGNPLYYEWDLDNDGAFDDADGITATIAFYEEGVYSITLRVKDDCGLTSTDSLIVTIQTEVLPIINLPPVAEAGEDITVDEGEPINLDGAASTDPEGKPLTYNWDLDNDGNYDDANGINTQYVPNDNGVYTIGLSVTDQGNLTSTDSKTIRVENVAPVMSDIVLPNNPQKIKNDLSFSATFTDPGILDTFTTVWDWKDGTTSAGTIMGQNITGNHSYTNPGIYTATLTLTDKDGGTAQKSTDGLVVISPSAASVFGSGWINSPAGSTLSRPMVIGKVNFDFNASYRRASASSPSGKTSFTIRGQGFKFVSSAYSWLIIDGKTSILEGSGTVNGTGDYGFLVSIQDGAWYIRHSDSIRIKIWNKATGEVIYDTQPGAANNALATTAVNGGIFTINK